jgi:hypothetical protein
LKIYKSCFVLEDPITCSARRYDSKVTELRRMNASAQLLATCRLISNEATPVLFSENRFVVEEGLARLRKLVKMVGKTSVAFIKTLTITYWAGDAWDDSFSTFRLFSDLRCLRIRITFDTIRGSQPSQIWPRPGEPTEPKFSPFMDETMAPSLSRPLLNRIFTSNDFEILVLVTTMRSDYVRATNQFMNLVFFHL